VILQLGEDYQIRPANPGLELYKHTPAGQTITFGKYKGQKTKESWRSMGLYPSNYEHALKLIANDYASKKEGRLAIKEGLEDVANYINSIARSAKILELMCPDE